MTRSSLPRTSTRSWFYTSILYTTSSYSCQGILFRIDLSVAVHIADTTICQYRCSVTFAPEYEAVRYPKERVVLTWHDQNHNHVLHLEPTLLDMDASLISLLRRLTRRHRLHARSHRRFFPISISTIVFVQDHIESDINVCPQGSTSCTWHCLPHHAVGTSFH